MKQHGWEYRLVMVSISACAILNGLALIILIAAMIAWGFK